MHFSKILQILAGSFSAVSKPNFARKYAFDSIFQALQDLHPFAPLQSQNFRKKSVWKISNFRENSATFCKCCKNLQNFAIFGKWISSPAFSRLGTRQVFLFFFQLSVSQFPHRLWKRLLDYTQELTKNSSSSDEVPRSSRCFPQTPPSGIVGKEGNCLSPPKRKNNS